MRRKVVYDERSERHGRWLPAMKMRDLNSDKTLGETRKQTSPREPKAPNKGTETQLVGGHDGNEEGNG
jgi:hypothetical protein